MTLVDDCKAGCKAKVRYGDAEGQGPEVEEARRRRSEPAGRPAARQDEEEQRRRGGQWWLDRSRLQPRSVSSCSLVKGERAELAVRHSAKTQVFFLECGLVQRRGSKLQPYKWVVWISFEEPTTEEQMS